MAAPFSLPREWADCACCRAGNWKRYFDGDDPEAAFAPCPECSQPPRCRAGSATKDRHCPRPGTIQPWGNTGRVICGQCYRLHELACDEGEWQDAREQLTAFRRLAEVNGNGALVSAMDLAYAEAEMRLASIERDTRLVEEWPNW